MSQILKFSILVSIRRRKDNHYFGRATVPVLENMWYQCQTLYHICDIILFITTPLLLLRDIVAPKVMGIWFKWLWNILCISCERKLIWPCKEVNIMDVCSKFTRIWSIKHSFYCQLDETLFEKQNKFKIHFNR